MPHNNTEADRTRAEAIFKAREQRKADAPKAMKDYQAAQQAIRDRTKRLRDERIAREADGADSADAAPPPSKAAKTRE
jgi:hypothetical protein